MTANALPIQVGTRPDDELTTVHPKRAAAAVAWVRTFVAILVVAAGGSALAQNVVVFVNGEPITAVDVDQRSKFLLLTTQKQTPRQAVVDQLIDEKLKVREGKRWGIVASDKEVENNYASMASRLRQSPEQLTQTLAKSGINPDTLKSRIRADIVWGNLIRGRYSARLQTSDSEVQSLLETNKSEERDIVGYDYLLRPILFLVTPGSPDTTYINRRKEAEALRGRFKGCEESIPAVRAMRDVAVRDQVVRSSADLPEGLRKVLDSVPLGQLTAPEVTRHGIEMFAVCAKHESKTDTPGRRAAREKLLGERFEQESKRYLRSLRKNALIERGK